MSSDRIDELIRERLSPDGQVLSLKAQFIREVGAKALAQKEELKNLRALDLTQNDIGDEGAKAIAESEIFSNLRTLNLKSNRIGDDGAFYLANSKTLKNLRSMALIRAIPLPMLWWHIKLAG